MKNYELTIFNQSRVIAIVFLFPVSLLVSLFLGIELMPDNYFWIASISIFLVLSGLMYYFAKGNLTIEFDEEILSFTWEKKLLFNYSPIESIAVADIETIVVDRNELLKKIITSDRVLNISNGKLHMKDSQEFINLLETIINQNGGRKIDSWDVWREKGYLKWALRINTFIIVSILVIFIVVALIKGFDKIPPTSFIMLIFLIPQMLMYQMEMKKK